MNVSLYKQIFVSIMLIFLINSCGGDTNSNNPVINPDSLNIEQVQPVEIIPFDLEIIGYSNKHLHIVWGNVENIDIFRIYLKDEFNYERHLIEVRNGSLTEYYYPVDLLDYSQFASKIYVEACNQAYCVETSTLIQQELYTNTIAYLKSSNTNPSDYFGYSIDINQNGTVMVVSALNEGSNSKIINGDEENNLSPKSGAVYVYRNIDNHWHKVAYLKASNADSDDQFGVDVSISDNGKVIAVGARGEDSNSDLINAGETNNDAVGSGAVYVFRYQNNNWSQTDYIKASNSDSGDGFGWSVSLSGDGNTLAVGAQYEASDANGINNDQGNSPLSAYSSGAVYLYRFSNNQWQQKSYIKASNSNDDDLFGLPVVLSQDGNTLAVGARGKRSFDYSLIDAGAVYLFRFSGESWSEDTLFRSSNANSGDYYGSSIDLSADGNTLIVGAYGADVGNHVDSGEAYAYHYFDDEQIQYWRITYIRPHIVDDGDWFGASVSISDDANIVVIGARRESSNSTGLNGDFNDNSKMHSGAVYWFVDTLGDYYYDAHKYIKAPLSDEFDGFGLVRLSGNADVLIVSSPNEDSNAINLNGNKQNNSAPQSGAVYQY